MYCSEQFNRFRRLVGLQMADQMPFGTVQIPKCVGLPSEFLHPILAEHPQSGIVSLPNALCGKRLADRHQCDVFGLASGTTCGSGDSVTNTRNVFRNAHFGALNQGGATDLISLSLKISTYPSSA